MIETEIAVFAACFAAGMLSGVLAAFLLTLGRGSGAARAVFDFLTPLVLGAVFFFTLRVFASGVFRLYSLIAFLGGALFSRRIVRRLSPWFKRLLCRLIVPIKSLESKVSARIGKALLPLKNRLKARRAKREEKRRAARALAAENERRRSLEKKKRQKDQSKKSASKGRFRRCFCKDGVAGDSRIAP